MDELRDTSPTCAHCGKPMRFVRRIPGIGGLRELYTGGCKECGVSVTLAGEPGERRAVS